MSLRKKGKRKKKQEEKNVHHRQELWSLHVSERFEVSSEPGFGLEVRVASAFSNMFFYIKISFGSASPKVFHRQILGVFDKFQSTSEKVFHA